MKGENQKQSNKEEEYLDDDKFYRPANPEVWSR